MDSVRGSAPLPSMTSGWARRPAVGHRAMVATSHPLATQAGLRAFQMGGNAADAALAAAAVATVAEPNTNGPGGDLCAIVWIDGRAYGLNGTGRSPGVVDAPRVDASGPRSVTVPGAVRAWSDLAERYARLGLDRALAPAIDLAARGVPCSARISELWAETDRPPWSPPAPGERYALGDLAGTLGRIASAGPEAFYEGEIARAITSCCWLREEDLLQHRSEWVEPLRVAYRGRDVYELPPNTQGAAALLALALLDGLGADLHQEIEATKLALADAYAWIGDAPLPRGLFEPDALRARRALIRNDRAGRPSPSRLPVGGTTYLCAVDEGGMAVSLIQSLYMSFGSGIVAPGTGVVLQNRGACFAEDPGHPNALAPAKRPFHTIMPGLLASDGDLIGPFGIVGGAMQPQAHVQFVSHVVDDGADPQAALDAPRWRLDGDWTVELEPGLAETGEELRALGHRIRPASSRHPFGAGQAILRGPGGVLLGGSDSRADGYAAAWEGW